MNNSIIEVEGQRIQHCRSQEEAQREADANRRVCAELERLLAMKNAGYGRNLQRHGLKGITIRLSDKMMRLENQVLGGNPDYVGESVRDTLFDIAGYAVKALALLDLQDLSVEGEWRGVAKSYPKPDPTKFTIHPWEARKPQTNATNTEIEVHASTIAMWEAES